MKTFTVTFILLSVCGIAFFGNYMYVPALPDISSYFNATAADVAATVTAILIGMGISQLILGPLSDSLGRKKILILSILITLAGLFVSSMAPSLLMLTLGRFIQGLGVGGIVLLYRTIIRDFFPHDQLARVVSSFVIFTATLPSIAPFAGGFFLEMYNWRILFIFLTIITTIPLLIAIFLFKETLPKNKRSALNAKSIFLNYFRFFKNKKYITCVALILTSYAGIITMLTASPFIFENGFGVSKSLYGILILIATIFSVMAGTANTHYHKSPRKHRPVMIFGIYLSVIGGLLLILSQMLSFNTIASTVVFMAIFSFGASLTYINSTTVMMKSLEINVGLGIAFSGFMQLIGSGIIMLIAANIHITSCFSLGITIIILAIISFIILSLYKGPKNLSTQQ